MKAHKEFLNANAIATVAIYPKAEYDKIVYCIPPKGKKVFFGLFTIGKRYFPEGFYFKDQSPHEKKKYPDHWFNDLVLTESDIQLNLMSGRFELDQENKKFYKKVYISIRFAGEGYQHEALEIPFESVKDAEFWVNQNLTNSSFVPGVLLRAINRD